MISDAFRFFWFNARHYSLALWGVRLRFDPAYPWVTKFFPSVLAEPVFEYRTYGLHALWAMLLAAWLPFPVLAALVALWAGVSWDRSKYLKSALVFWRQVVRENGVSHSRGHGRYIEQLIREMERRMKSGEDWQECAQEAAILEDRVIRAAGSRERSKRFLAGV